jgi:hypothetical protein
MTRKFWMLVATLLVSGCMALAAESWTGKVSDSMCGAKHMMGGGPRECTLECVDAGSKFVLVDAKGKVYGLSDQKKPRPFAGEKVKVTGTLKDNTIEVSSIESAQ